MSNINYDVDAALELTKKIKMDYGTYSSIFPWSNEEVYDTTQTLCKKNTSVLTVTSSSDHIFNAALRGSTDITAFDINLLSIPYLDLKISALLNFDRDNFMKFMPGLLKDDEYLFTLYEQGDINFEDYETIQLINDMDVDESDIKRRHKKREELFHSRSFLEDLKNINPNSYNFWLKLYEKSPSFLNSSFFRRTSCGDIQDIAENIGYLRDDQMYELLREKIPGLNINTICTDILDLPVYLKKEKKSFGFIHLSNIGSSAIELYPRNFLFYSVALKKYLNFIHKKIYNHLDQGGVMITNYIHNIDDSPEESYINDTMQMLSKNTKHKMELLTLPKGDRVYYKKKGNSLWKK